MRDRIERYYEQNPLMISSPFGGVDGINQELVQATFHRLDIHVQTKSILDVGCGRGFMADMVRSMGGEYTGVDLAPSRGGFRFARASADALPFPDKTFDGVFCIDAFEHFPDPDAAALEFRRVLKRGGFVFLSAPNYGNVAGLVKWFCENFGGYAKDTWAPFRQWQPQELEHMLTGPRVRSIFNRAGFHRALRVGHGAEVGAGLFPWLEHPRMPEAIKFRMQRASVTAGPFVARCWPGASLHGFWKFETGVAG